MVAAYSPVGHGMLTDTSPNPETLPGKYLTQYNNYEQNSFSRIAQNMTGGDTLTVFSLR